MKVNARSLPICSAIILVLLLSHRDGRSQNSSPGELTSPGKIGKTESAVEKIGSASRTKSANAPSKSGGARSITVNNRGEAIEIKDVNDRQITIKHTRSIAGQMETIEYQADDLASLKLKSPSAAALYSKYTTPATVSASAPLRIQFPLQAREPVGDPDQRSIDDELEPSRHGPRRVRVDLKDRRIEIFDGGGESIRLRIIQVEEEKEKTEEFVADGILRFKEAYPELFRLYERYTGIRYQENSDSSK